MPRTQEILSRAARSRWTVLLAGVFFLALIEMTLLQLDAGMPSLAVVGHQARHAEVVPLSKIEAFCSTNGWAGLLPATGMASAFFTTNFVPPPPPSSPKPVAAPGGTPPPPPSTTKKIALIYRGFSESAAGLQQAFVKIGDALVIGTNGSTVVADFTIANFNLKSLTLRNNEHTNVFDFNVSKEIEVPAP